MAANPVLVDSSWYIRLLREGRNPLRELARIREVRKLATCGVVRCEVGRGISDPNQLRKFQAVWDVMVFVKTDDQLWRDTQDLLCNLDRQGQIIPLADAVIACCARRLNAVVLTFDAHFSIIPGIVAAERIV